MRGLRLGASAILAGFAIGGCASTADLAPPASAGSLTSDHAAQSERVISMALRDPGSAIYEHRREPYLLVCKSGVFGNKTPIEVWAEEVWVNARNGFGGYTGFQPYTVLFIPDPATGEMRIQANVGLGGGRVTSMSGICH